MNETRQPMNVMRCKVCNALLKEEGIDWNRGVATCTYCNAVMRFDNQPSNSASFAQRPIIDQPSRFRIEEQGGAFSVHWSWFTPVALFFAVFSVVWMGFLLFWYGIAFAMDTPLIMKLFPMLHVGIGCFMAYFTACMFLNSSHLTIDRGELTVMHGPLPWPGNKQISVHDFEQFYCTEVIRHGKNGPKVSYSLYGLTHGRRKELLLKNLEESDHALFIEQQLEKFLKIQDKPVAGELPR